MADEDNTNPQSKRYNTRPKTKTSFEALESKYTNFYVDTSPKATRKQRVQQYDNSEKQQRQMRAQMYPVSQEQGPFGPGSYYPASKSFSVGTEIPNRPPFQKIGGDSTQNLQFRPNQPPSMPPHFHFMYGQQPFKVPPNYQGMFRQNVMQLTTKAPMVFNQMPPQVDPSRFRMITPSYNPNTQFAMRPQAPSPHHQPQPLQGYQNQGPRPQPPYGFPNVSPSVVQYPENSPQRPLQMPIQDNRVIPPVKLDAPKPGFPPEIVSMVPKVTPFPVKSPQPAVKVPVQTQNEQMNSYFSAVDIILKDISETNKYEKQPEKYHGRMSIPESFELPDFHKMVYFDYLIDNKLYNYILVYFKKAGKYKVEFPVNGTNPQPENTTPKESNNENSSMVALCSENQEPETPKENIPEKNDKEKEFQEKFSTQMIQLVREKKIFPITFESCKKLSFDELNPFFTLLTKSNCKVIKSSGLKKCRVKSVLSTQEDNKSHYLVYNNEDEDNNKSGNAINSDNSNRKKYSRNKYSLKYQFGCFFGNDFFNKRVPLFTSVDFGDVNPSFMFTKNIYKRKQLKSSLNYIKVYRTYDIFVKKLDLYLTFEVSKILVESDKDLKNTKHQLSVHCNLETVPKVLNTIHFK